MQASSLARDRGRWDVRLTRRFELGSGSWHRREGLAEAGIIRGRVFEDMNGNGVLDPREPGIPGIPLRLGSGATTFSTADGSYVFEQAATGLESVSLDPSRLPARYLTPGERRWSAALKPGETVVRDWPIRRAAGVVGRVVLTDGTGAAGVADVLVAVRNSHHDVFTDAEGRFYIPGLKPGTIVLDLVRWSFPEGTIAHGEPHREVILIPGEVVNAGVFVLEPAPRPVIQIFRPRD